MKVIKKSEIDRCTKCGNHISQEYTMPYSDKQGRQGYVQSFKCYVCDTRKDVALCYRGSSIVEVLDLETHA